MTDVYVEAGFSKRQKGERFDRDLLPLNPEESNYEILSHIETGNGHFQALRIVLEDGTNVPCYRRHEKRGSVMFTSKICQDFSYKAYK